MPKASNPPAEIGMVRIQLYTSLHECQIAGRQTLSTSEVFSLYVFSSLNYSVVLKAIIIIIIICITIISIIILLLMLFQFIWLSMIHMY